MRWDHHLDWGCHLGTSFPGAIASPSLDRARRDSKEIFQEQVRGSWIGLPRISDCKVSSPSTKCNTSQISRKPWCTGASLLIITPLKAIRWWAYPLILLRAMEQVSSLKSAGIGCSSIKALCDIAWLHQFFLTCSAAVLYGTILLTCHLGHAPSSVHVYRAEQTAIRLGLFHSRRKEYVVRKNCKERT